jgi:hypothetical protein
METDIIREIRAFRDAFAAAHGYDVHAIGDALRKQLAESGRPVVSFGPRPAEPIEPLPRREPQTANLTPAKA